MTKPKPSRTLLLGVVLLAIFAAGVIAARSTLTDKDELRAHLKSRFAAWTGGELSIEGATRVAIFPRTRIEVDDVRIGKMDRMAQIERAEFKSMRAEFGFMSLLMGDPSISLLTLFAPTIELERDVTTNTASAEPTLIKALQRAPFSRLTIEQGEIGRAGASAADKIEQIQGNMTVSPTGATSLEGTFTWRGEAVTYGIESQPPDAAAKTASIPVQMTFGGNLITASVDGNALLGDTPRLQGSLNLTLPDARRFARWLGFALADGAGLGPFNATGDFNWEGHRIAYDNGTYELDGNRAIGALAVLFDKSRPEIDGTLALQTLSLDTYLSRPQGDSDEAQDAEPDIALDVPLLHHVNLDLRLSATQLRANLIEAGQTALTLSAKGGALSADVSILDFFGGRAAGRLEFDATQEVPRLHLSAALNELTAKSLIETFSAESPVEGGFDAQFDVTGYGRKLGEWLGRISGNFNIVMNEATLDFDLAKVRTETRQSELRGWPAVRGQSTRIKQFKAGLVLEGGSAHSEDFALQAGTEKITGHGIIDIASRKIDWRLDLPEAAETAAEGEDDPLSKLTHSLHIFGPWAEPTFRLEEKRAEHPASIDQRVGAAPPARAF